MIEVVDIAAWLREVGPERAIVSPVLTSLIREFARIRVGFWITCGHAV
jgi:hypothetical protein